MMIPYKKSFKYRVIGIAILLCSFANAGYINKTHASAKASKLVSQNNEERFGLENEFLSLEIDSVHGARASSFIVKRLNQELVMSGGGFLFDHFWEQSWPGEFFNAPYKVTILQDGPDIASIKAERISTGGMKNILTQKDILLERTITLRKGSPILEVTVKLSNAGQSDKLFGYWVQHIFYPSGIKRKILYFRPSRSGISEATYDPAINKYEGPDFVRDPQSEWTATIDEESGNGLVFVTQYDWLRFLYNCQSSFTTEWQYERVGLPQGKSWQTTYWCYPIHDFKRVDYASRYFVAAVEPSDDDGRLNVKVQLLSASDSLRDVIVTGEIEGLVNDRVKRPLTEWKAGEIHSNVSSHSFQVLRSSHDPVVIRLKVRGRCQDKTFTETFETFYGSKYGSNRKVDGSPLYILPQPGRHREFLKPEKIVKKQNLLPRVLFCKGLFADNYFPQTIFEHINAEVITSYLSAGGVFGSQLSLFPASYDELMSYDVIILVNIDAEAIGERGAEMLKDFVSYGGILVYAGDLYGFDRGGITSIGVDKILPIEEGLHSKISLVNYSSNIITSPELKGISFSSNASVVYMNEGLKLLPEAKIELSIGKIPLVASKNIGKGRVIAILATALGEARKGSMLFLDDPAWSKAMVLCIFSDR
ncbi:MAG: hypothetical protein L6437_14000 [Kiritimatiellae bacterium]|nr:hypothetical protein [Kiritimatiellia bacterium]